MNFMLDKIATNKHNDASMNDAILSRNQVLRGPHLGVTSQPIRMPNRHSSTSAGTSKTMSTAKRKPNMGTMANIAMKFSDTSQVIVALCEGRGKARGTVGIAAMTIAKPALMLCQISDTQTYTNTLTKINILRPVEVLIPSSFVECATPSRIYTLIKDQFPKVTVSSVSRSAFRSNRGLSYITSLCAPEFKSVTLVVREKFYALASASALIKYIQKKQHIMYPTRSIKIEYQEPEDTAVIDVDSANRLELVTSCNDEEHSTSLLLMLDHCVTGVGRKMLRTTILQPPCIDPVIKARLDCVQELLENTDLRIKLKGVLINLHNIEFALLFGTMVPQSAAAVSDKQLNYTLQLKTLLTNIEPLCNELEGAHHPLFRRIHEQLVQAPFCWLLKKLHKVLTEEAHPATGHAGDLQRCCAIRTGLNGFLDIARRTYMELIDDMRAYVQNLSDKHSLPLRLHHTQKRGYHIVMNLTGNMRDMKKSSLPPVFVKVEKIKNIFIMTTSDMTNYCVRLRTNCQEIVSISNVIIYQLMANIRQCIGHLYRLCDDVALLDVLQSLATVSTTSGYIRPQFSGTHMEIIGARHPLLEHMAVREPVPNNIAASDLYNLHIVTGPNMSGKSIYVRQMPLLQVLAQIGCYVPARTATFRSCTHVYARISVEDYLHDNSSTTTSTFVREMTEVQYMLNTVGTGSRAMVVLDELCHSTSVDEGVSIAMAICEELLRTDAYIFVATHFLSMTRLANMYYSVSNAHLEAVESVRDARKCLKFTHRLIAGINGVETYGIMLSRICGGSDMVSDRAEEILHALLPTHKTITSSACQQNATYRKYRLYADLKLLQLQGKLTDELERKRLDEYETLTGHHYDIGQVLSIDKIPSRTSSSRGSRTTKSSSTAAASNKDQSKPSTSVYDQARAKCNREAFDKPITESADSKIVDSLIPSEADFLYCITADSPELDCADAEHDGDQLGISVKRLVEPTDSDLDVEKDDASGEKSFDYDSDSPTYSPNFDLNNDTDSDIPDSNGPVDIMDLPPSLNLNTKEEERTSLLSQRSETNSLNAPSFDSQPSSTRSTEPINPDRQSSVQNVPSSYTLQCPDFLLFEPIINLRTPSPIQPRPASPVPDNRSVYNPRHSNGSHDNMRPGSFTYTQTQREYRTLYESTERHESVTVSTYYTKSNYCRTDRGSVEHTVRQETHYTSYQEFSTHCLSSGNSGSRQTTTQRSPWSTQANSHSYNANPSTSGYQSNVLPNRQISHTSVRHTNTDDIAYASTSGFQSEPQHISKSRSATYQESSDSRVPRQNWENVLPNQPTNRTTVQHNRNSNDMARPSTSGMQPKPQCQPTKNASDQDSFGEQKYTFESTKQETRTENPFMLNPDLSSRKPVSFDFSAKRDPASFLDFANTNRETAPANPDFKFEHRIQPRQKPTNYLSFLRDKPNENTSEVNVEPSALKRPVNTVDTQPGTSRSATDGTTETLVPKRARGKQSKKSESQEPVNTLFDLFLKDFKTERKKIDELIDNDDDDDEFLHLAHACSKPKQDPAAVTVIQRPKEGILSEIMNPKKGTKRKSRSDKGIQNTLPFAHSKKPAKTRTKRVPSLCNHEKKTTKRQCTVPESYVPASRAKVSKLSTNTPYPGEDPSKKRKVSEAKVNVSDTSGSDESKTKRRLPWSDILSGPPLNLTAYKDSVISGVAFLEESTSDEDMTARLCTDRTRTKSVHDTAANSDQQQIITILDSTLESNKSSNGNNSTFSVGSEGQFIRDLMLVGTTSTPLSNKFDNKEKSNMSNPYHRQLTAQEREDLLLESSDNSFSSDFTLDNELKLRFQQKVRGACPKKRTPKQKTNTGSKKTPTKTLRNNKGKRGNSRNKLQQHGAQQNVPIVVNETLLSAAISQPEDSKSQTVHSPYKLRPPKLIIKNGKSMIVPTDNNNEETEKKQKPYTYKQKVQNKKPKAKNQKGTNVKPEKQPKKRNTRVSGKPKGMAKTMQTDGKLSEDLGYNKLETNLMAPVRGKRQREMDKFFDDVERLRANMEATRKQLNSQFDKIKYCPPKKQLSNLEYVAVGQRDADGEMNVAVNEPKSAVTSTATATITTPAIDRIIEKYKEKADV